MSWPADGLPRYIVAKTEGLLDMPINKDGTNCKPPRTLPASFAVLDRAYCHATVAVFRSEDIGRGGHDREWTLARAEEKAREAAERLNAEAAA